MWILYLLLAIIGILIVGYTGLMLFLWLKHQQEIRLAKNVNHNRDPLLKNLDPTQGALLYFTSDTCVPCKTMQSPAIKRLQEQMPNLSIITIDALTDPDIATRWHVMSLPRTFIIGKNRQVHTTNMDVADTNLLKSQLEAAMQSSSNSVQVNLREKSFRFRLPRINIQFTQPSNRKLE